MGTRPSEWIALPVHTFHQARDSDRRASKARHTHTDTQEHRETVRDKTSLSTIHTQGSIMEYAARITREGKWVLAEFPDCPGCQTFADPGQSIDELAQDALKGWLESHLKRDLAPPRPKRHRTRPGVQYHMIPVSASLAVRLELRWAREEAKLTQAQLAKVTGMTQQQVQRLESANANPTIATLERIARGLGRNLTLRLAPERG
jgi:DNA-binding XRE family transcriptional regulator/predicted RNase H-like HicB family nuclease